MPTIVADLAAEWRVSLEPTLAGGSSAYVAEATTADGTAAVLKITMPGEEPVEHETRALSLAQGRGYARLLAADPARRAILVERLGATLASRGWSPARQLETLAETLVVAWRPLPEPQGLLPLPDKAAWLIHFVVEAWETLGRPCDRAVIDRAIGYAEARAAAHDPTASVLLHGDPHAHNALADPHAPGRFRLIDPDGVWGEPAYDVGAMLRGGSQALLDGDALALGRARCARMAALTGQSEEAVWAWSYVERVSTALYAWKLGGEVDGRRMLAVAEAWSKGPA